MLWYIAIGSAAAGVARFTIGSFIQQKTGSVFPVGTLLVNVSGSMLLVFRLDGVSRAGLGLRRL